MLGIYCRHLFLDSQINASAPQLETFLYGLYAILFAICVYVLWRKKTLPWVLLASAVAMFALATADIAYTYYLLFGKIMQGNLGLNELRPKFWLYVTNKCVTSDVSFIPGCRLTWICGTLLTASLLIYYCYTDVMSSGGAGKLWS